MATAHIIPRVYIPPYGGPVYWRDEQSGVLAEAVNAYLDHVVDKAPAPTQEQFDLLKDYCDYWAHARCWTGEGLEDLRRQIKAVTTVDGLRGWLRAALDECIDPL